MSPALACFQAGNLTCTKCIKCVTVRREGAMWGRLLKATSDLGQLRTYYNGKEDSLGKITALRKQIKF